MTRTNTARTVVIAALAAFPACKTEFGPLGQYLNCTEDGRCVDGYRCARTELGAICLDEQQWAMRCGADESCNGRDDNCNGETDEALDDVVSGTDEGECAVRVERCQSGALVAVEPGVKPTDETCDGLDNDCDGVTDDGVPLLVSGLAVGECRLTVSACVDGEYHVLPGSEGRGPTDESCNERDDNCDGETDEAFPELDGECLVGVGACAAIGAFKCDEGGGVACNASPGTPSTELCDDVDNNCDGVTDETFAELRTACSVGVGACVATGVRICRGDGFGTRCSVESGSPVSESCDGFDNDCNGFIDDGLGSTCCIPGTTHACGVNLGACTVGTQSCSQDRQWGACSGQQPAPESCDGFDNDCNGSVDDGTNCACTAGSEVACSVTRGVCVAGVQTCESGGAWGECSGVLPSIDVCDGADNDCDGVTDEDFPNLEEPCSVGVGACAASGVRVCVVDGLGMVCGATAGMSSDERCDLVDNDCDGDVDDGLVIVTGTDVGECVKGIERCTGGAWVSVEGRVDPVAEICDWLDNDCDGIADDEAPNCCTPGEVRTCGLSVGLCTVGSQTCGEDRAWGGCSGALPVAESCDGFDNDCDGVTDNPWHYQLGSACTSGIGSCARAGAYRCAGDGSGAVCDAVPGTPGTESCNGADDDCDTFVDEIADVPPRIEGPSDGACRPSVSICRSGEYVEVQRAVGPVSEMCNGLDDDCDRLTDNGITSVACYEGPDGTAGIGVCRSGTTTCSGGNVRCIGQTLPSAETCDGFDDDCDGVTDGSLSPSGTPVALAQPCYSGPPGTLGVGACRTGTTTCSGGLWSGCAGEVVPDHERCEALDGLDNDCDGATDEWTLEMASIPETTFTMGSPEGVGNTNEHPQHQVALSSYCVDKYETTNALYRACVDAVVCVPPVDENSRTRVGYFRDPTYDQYPVINITWYMADTFCRWEGKRLPTEAQWELAARGIDGRTYPWGNEDPTCAHARFYDCVPRDTVAVDTLPLGISPYGAYHMAGNAGEWVADWYADDYFAMSPTNDPPGPGVGSRRVFRGGSLSGVADDFRAAARQPRLPDAAVPVIGFRCAQ